MRCTRIEFHGFRRLADTATNLDGLITAFVGPNEAGKTTILDALVWLTDGGELPVVWQSRSHRPTRKQAVVRAFFALSKDDLATVSQFALNEEPRTLAMLRRADGSVGYEISPAPRRPARVFDLANRRLAESRARLKYRPHGPEAHEDDDGPGVWADRVAGSLKEPDAQWSEEALEQIRSLTGWLDEPASARSTKPRDARLAALLREVEALVASEHPRRAVEAALVERIPSFVSFTEQNRVLATSHEMSSEALRANPPPALRDLLRIAGVDLDTLWTHTANGDTSSRESLLDQGNARLLTFFDQSWNQAKIAVRISTSGTQLEIFVKELRDGGPVTNIEERSDGLRVFVALVAFLASGGWQVPPVLLIDEAETHLHFDAQADLVGVLLRSLDAEQVLYSTHSPGCLPSDLGTGIRLVARDPDDLSSSVIKSNFWADEEPGYAPLLFAMGAGAAAFSICRRAIVGEGPTEMVLLPSLLRLAAGVDDLGYQVAPGLSNARTLGMRVEEVAAKVVYLADGDGGGDNLVKHLAQIGVRRSRIFQLPKGMAVEDLVPVEDYLAAVNGLLAEMNQPKRLGRSDLADGVPVATCYSNWAKRLKIQAPSKIEIAYRLLAADQLRLKGEAKKHLRSLHTQVLKAFDEARLAPLAATSAASLA